MGDTPSRKITVSNHTEPLEFAAQSSSLLETLEQANIEVPYQCREGFCGACRAKLESGEVVYNQEPLAFVRDGEVLLCCTKPLTDIKLTLI
ncbi:MULTISPECIES: class I ribonucleotide reductase maintenance protein YfaE [Pseudoalteromonas]|uniref:Ferredoxin n=1 Tax=Pseudoalteromonas amylolytica TaxID=1859457 RepID=A0A1S1MX70_9GAMM|nr:MULTISPECIES: class I ribonucleotide reductase maintenance protein YfaE [Pseudoalteromonas]MCF6434040.1 class I ribonucleotide reductase maintenance protein YfaE [Pseudoalteromonas sp. MMG022]OHU88049.1 ferredoxin [Pseudoalteromonas sp. JW3]OHU91489.1 ferredoxin [Pseudoalteromonas amylolytica]